MVEIDVGSKKKVGPQEPNFEDNGQFTFRHFLVSPAFRHFLSASRASERRCERDERQTNEPANNVVISRKRANETKPNAMPTYPRVARAAQPPSDAAPELAALPGAGDMSNDRAVIGTPADDQPACTPMDLSSSSGTKRSPAASPLPGTLHYQGDTTEDETGSIGDGQPPTKKRPRRTKKVAQKRCLRPQLQLQRPPPVIARRRRLRK